MVSLLEFLMNFLILRWRNIAGILGAFWPQAKKAYRKEPIHYFWVAEFFKHSWIVTLKNAMSYLV